MKLVEGPVWHPSWMSLVGCFKGCMDFLGRDDSRAWIAGGCGHAFVINMHEVVCPSGPTAWNCSPVRELGRNVGWVGEQVIAFKSQDDFPDKQREAFEFVRAALDAGKTCFGWEMPVPEYYIIRGYDDTGYYTSGPGHGPDDDVVLWDSVGDTGIGVLQVNSLALTDPAPDEVVVREALAFALELVDEPARLTFGENTMGLGAFDVWADALEGGTADRFGLGYNGECWAESRADATAFLREAKERLPETAGALFDDAADCYSEVHEKLAAVSKLYPFEHCTGESEAIQDADAAALVREAKAAEEQGVGVLRELVAAV